MAIISWPKGWAKNNVMIRGFVCSAFDLLHAGHVLLLKGCKEHCEHLTVGLQVNPSLERGDKNKPIQSLLERHIQLEGSRYVDEIIVYETEEDLENILKIYEFDIRFLGEDYKDGKKKITGEDLCSIYFIPRKHPFSSTELRGRIKKNEIK